MRALDDRLQLRDRVLAVAELADEVPVFLAKALDLRVRPTPEVPALLEENVEVAHALLRWFVATTPESWSRMRGETCAT